MLPLLCKGIMVPLERSKGNSPFSIKVLKMIFKYHSDYRYYIVQHFNISGTVPFGPTDLQLFKPFYSLYNFFLTNMSIPNIEIIMITINAHNVSSCFLYVVSINRNIS